MKIIELGREELLVFRGTCKTCQCVVEAAPSDFLNKHGDGDCNCKDNRSIEELTAKIKQDVVRCPTLKCKGKILVSR